MKVYLVEWFDYESSRVMGVFSSRQAVQDAIEREKHGKQEYFWRKEDLDVTEWDVQD